MATRAAAGAFKRAYLDPGGKSAAFDRRRQWYAFLWACHENVAYDDFEHFLSYREHYHLYRNIRGIYNPARRIADFYAGFVYPGPLDEAIPLETENDALKDAIGQVWQWSNWLAGKGVMTRWGAALGDVMTVVVDDVARGKVYLENVWPGQIAALELDPMGNVKSYRQEYTALDDRGIEYEYAKEVDQESIRTFRNGNPFAYGDAEAETPNPYGFVPAAWSRHRNVGGLHGEQATAGCQPKIDELTQVMSAVNDRVMAIINSPLLVATDANAKAVLNTPRSGPTSEQNPPDAFKDSIKILKVPVGSTATMLELSIKDVYPAMDHMLAEIEKDMPELTVHEQLRQMSQVTGPAAARIMGDAVNRLADAAAGYDQQSIKLFQMAVAVAGWRASQGAWGGRSGLNSQRAKFLPFNLQSYERGDLDLTIAPRPLIRETDAEQAQTLILKKSLGVDDEQALTELGYPEDVIAKMTERKAAAAATMGKNMLAAFDRGTA
jgi:hypothetical protein